MLVYIVGVLAAIAIPAYQEYTVRAKVAAAVAGSQNARESLGNYYLSRHEVPESLKAAGVDSQLVDGTPLSFDPQQMVLTARIKQGEIIFTPTVDDKGRVVWRCSNGEGLKPKQLPASCRAAAGQ